MADSPDHFQRLIRRLHRRQVTGRVLDRVGFCVVGGCALAILMMVILLFRGRPAMPVAVAGLALSLLVGMVWGFVQRPSLLATAIEADRQLQLADLLSTAWTIRATSAGDPWLRAIVAAADERCRSLPAASVVLNRLNPRIWGGAGLATALMLTIGVMAANPLTSAATGTLPTDGPRDGTVLEAADHSQIVFAPANARDPFTSPGRDPDEEMRNGPGEGMEDSPKDAQSKHEDSAAGSGASGSGALEEGAGAGSAQTSTHKNDHGDLTAAGTGATAANTGHTAAGTGQGTDAATGAGTTGGRAGEQSPIAEAPAWSSPSWPADREAAMKAAETRRLPGGYREMVRAYFERRGE